MANEALNSERGKADFRTATSRFADQTDYRAVASIIDGEKQPYRLLSASAGGARPLLVLLHTWRGDWQQNMDHYLEHAVGRDWHCLLPDYRGPNVRPQACASPLAIQDVLDAMEAVQRDLEVDPTRIYLVGGSGGGHMAMMLAAICPERFTAISAWGGISDLLAWRRENLNRDDADGYASDIEQCVGGEPDVSPAAHQQAMARSPLQVLKQQPHTNTLTPLDLNAGVHDGKTGSVPFWHSVWYYNVLATRLGGVVVTEGQIEALWRDGLLADSPPTNEERLDPLYNKHPIVLRRTSGHIRLTLFDGGHTAIPAAAIGWLSGFQRQGDQLIHRDDERRGDTPAKDSDSTYIEG